MDGAGSWWLESSPGELHPRLPQLSGSPDGFDHRSNSSSAFINNLRFQASKSIRTSFVILASFNALTAAATAAGIYWDCYKNSRRNDPDFRFKTSFWKLVGSAEIFPFMLSLSIIGQSITFAVVQSFGLQSSLILGCAPLSQTLLPSFLMVPYLQFTFGVEATIQALRPNNTFSARSKWSLQACLAIPLLISIGTYVLSRFVLPPNFCFASLVFFLRRWALGCFGVIVAIASTLLVGSGIVFYRLYQVSGIGEQERITASWMAWFMVLGGISMSITAPFFFSISADDGSKVSSLQSQLSMAAAVTVNLSGIYTGILYVLLRSSRLGKIGPKGYHEFDSRRSVRHPRTRKLHSFVFTKQMQQPVPVPARFPKRRATDYYSPTGFENAAAASDANNKDGKQDVVAATQPFINGVATTSSATAPASQQQYARKDSYNLFPPDGAPERNSTYMLPAAAYAPSGNDVGLTDPFVDEIPAPPTIWFSGGGRNRDSSFGSSSATVPIGLRVSNIENMPPVRSFYQMAPTAVSRRRNRPESAVPVPPMPSSLIISDTDAKESKDKQLPPVPLDFTKVSNEKDGEAPQEELRLSPTVYSAQKAVGKSKGKAPSPGANPPGRQNWTPESQSPINEAEWI
ncbi:hypothetical protein EsDP_00005462 [Epichloe bromicola]|uniref:Uncharacterized protein n=1 Tax=Epichloe bromicola TaxID=79588 RepID=A0ABQ0CUQ6_9HYPO